MSERLVLTDVINVLGPIYFLNSPSIIILKIFRKRKRKITEAEASSDESTSDLSHALENETSAIEELANFIDESVEQPDFVARGSIYIIPLIKVEQKYLPMPCDADNFKSLLEHVKYTTESQGTR